MFAFLEEAGKASILSESASTKSEWIRSYCQQRYSASTCDLLHLSLKSRYLSFHSVKCSEFLPKIQMFHTMAVSFSFLCKDADSFLVSSSGYACSPESLSALSPLPSSFILTQDALSSLLSFQSFDHPLSSCMSESPAPPMVLFTSITSNLPQWLDSLSSFCQTTPTTILLRFFHSASVSPNPNSRVGGYGIALDIKNTEYKVIDDRTKEGTLFQNTDEVLAEADTEVEGFYFSTLMTRYPSLASSLQQFKESLHSSSQPITPLQMKDLGLKLAQSVVRSQAPLRQLEEAVMNFPSIAGSLARVPVSDEVREEARRLAGIVGEMEGSVFLNGRRLRFDSTSFNLFEIMAFVREHIAFQKESSFLQLSPRDCDTIRGLLHTSLTSPSTFRFSLQVQSDPSILWVNDIEKDAPYARLPRSLRSFLLNSFMLPQVRANYLSRVFVIDPAADNREVYQTVYEVLQQRLPIRCGFLFSSPAPRERCSDTCRSVPLVRSDPIDPIQLGQLGLELLQGPSPLLFVVFFFNFLSQPDHSVGAALGLVDELTERPGSERVLAEGRHLETLARMVKKVGELGLKEEMEMVNGRVFELMNFQEFIREAYSDIELIVDGIERKKITKVAGILPFLLEASSTGEFYDRELLAPFAEQRFVEVDEALLEMEGSVRVMEGDVTTAVLSITPQFLHSFTEFPELKRTSLYLSTRDNSLLPLLSLLRHLSLHHLTDSLADVILCARNEGVSVDALTQCVNVYLEEEDCEKLGDSWKTDSQVERWNAKISPYFGEETSVVVNGRFFVFSLFSSSSLQTLVETDQRLSVPLHKAFPRFPRFPPLTRRISLLSLLPFIHAHLADFSTPLPSLPSSPFLLASSSSSPITFTAVIDPLTKPAQRFLALLYALQPLFPFSYSVLFVPHTDYSDLPLKRSFRYVASSDALASWNDLPPQYLYTMSVETPFRWSVISYYAECDLDNIRIIDENTFVFAQYVIEGIVMEGSCFNTTEQTVPAQGMMLELKKLGQEGVVSDTVVMNNRGYWQLKGDMGVYEIGVSKENADLAFVDDDQKQTEKVTVGINASAEK